MYNDWPAVNFGFGAGILIIAQLVVIDNVTRSLILYLDSEQVYIDAWIQALINRAKPPLTSTEANL